MTRGAQIDNSNVPRWVGVGASVFAVLMLTPIVGLFLLTFAFVLAPVAALVLPVVALGVRGDAGGRGRPMTRQIPKTVPTHAFWGAFTPR